MRFPASILALSIAVAFSMAPVASMAGVTTGGKAEKKLGETKATKVRGAAEDPNIKSSKAVNNPTKRPEAPPSKGGTARAGVVCLHLDNSTGLYVDLYADGHNQGTCGPWGDCDDCWYTSGDSVIFYAKAPFTDGSALTWGPRRARAPGSYDWQVTE